MKVLIRAGGRGSRLSEETMAKPNPLVAIGDQRTAGLCDYSSLESLGRNSQSAHLYL